MYTLNVKLAGLTCSACTKLAKKRIEKLGGVKEVDVQLSGETQILSERMIPKNEIKDVLLGSDYEII